MSTWSYIVTNKSNVTATNTQEVTFNILLDGGAIIENMQIEAAPSSLPILIADKVRTYADEYEQAQSIEVNREVIIIE